MVIRVALVVSEPKLPICKVLPPLVKINLSALNVSVAPSVLCKEYLSSSNGKYDSLSPAFTKLVLLDDMLTLYVFLIVIDAFVKSTSDMYWLGSSVNKLLSDELCNSVVKTLKSVTVRALVGKLPFTIPSTSATFSIVIVFVPTAVTLP